MSNKGRKPCYGIHIMADLETGEYEIEFEDLSHPGEGIVLDVLMEAVRIVLQDVAKKHTAELPQVGTGSRGDN